LEGIDDDKFDQELEEQFQRGSPLCGNGPANILAAKQLPDKLEFNPHILESALAG